MWQPRVVSVTTHPTSAAAEQVHLEGQAKSPYGEFVTRILNISSDFDMEKDSFAHGTSTGLLIAAESEPFRSHMIDRMHQWAGIDPQHDVAIIGMVRASCRTIRRFLDDEAVARQFARLLASQALRVLADRKGQ